VSKSKSIFCEHLLTARIAHLRKGGRKIWPDNEETLYVEAPSVEERPLSNLDEDEDMPMPMADADEEEEHIEVSPAERAGGGVTPAQTCDPVDPKDTLRNAAHWAYAAALLLSYASCKGGFTQSTCENLEKRAQSIACKVHDTLCRNARVKIYSNLMRRSVTEHDVATANDEADDVIDASSARSLIEDMIGKGALRQLDDIANMSNALPSQDVTRAARHGSTKLGHTSIHVRPLHESIVTNLRNRDPSEPRTQRTAKPQRGQLRSSKLFNIPRLGEAYVVDNDADGRCFWQCLAFGVYGDMSLWKVVKQKVHDDMVKANPSVARYAWMDQDYAWTEADVVAYVQTHGVDDVGVRLYYHHKSGESGERTLMPTFPSTIAKRRVCLLHSGNVGTEHFSLLVSRESNSAIWPLQDDVSSILHEEGYVLVRTLSDEDADFVRKRELEYGNHCDDAEWQGVSDFHVDITKQEEFTRFLRKNCDEESKRKVLEGLRNIGTELVTRSVGEYHVLWSTSDEKGGRGDHQAPHTDYLFPGEEVTPDANVPLVVVQSVQDGTKIRVWRRSFVPKEFDANWKFAKEKANNKDVYEELKHTWMSFIEVHVPKGYALVFRGDLIHAGYGYVEDNIRIHVQVLSLKDNMHVLKNEVSPHEWAFWKKLYAKDTTFRDAYQRVERA